MSEATQSIHRTLEGRVVSDKMQKTVTVLIERRVKHPVIGKVMIRSRKYHAHIDGLTAIVGDLVQIEECAPIAKTKAWRVTKVLEKGVAA
jgi:small subunit ribosomal protein S17